MVHRGLIYSVKCLKGPSDKLIKKKGVRLPDPPCLFIFFIYSTVEKKKTLFLDLDETLIHSVKINANNTTPDYLL